MKVNNSVITDIEGIVNSLPTSERERFQRIYSVTSTAGEQRIPQSMQSWVKQQFDSVEAVTRQKVVRITNLVTGDEALFNKLRSSRPIEGRGNIDARLQEARDNDLFCCPEDNTPEDLFGRVVGKYCITASNISKYDGLHGLVIFNDFDPLRFFREQVIDYIDVGWEWAKKARIKQPQAKYFFFIWNCLWRAGASIHHGHAQVMLATDRHYSRIEKLRRVALDYSRNYGSNYFTDLFQAHRSVGCAVEKNGVQILAHLTPFKDNEVIIIAEALNLSFKERIFEVLARFRDKLNITSFNLGLVTPPLAETRESWEGFPVIAWLVDRGELSRRDSDIGGMEIYAASVVSSDPLELARRLRQYLE
jgi:hypothetical protein